MSNHSVNRSFSDGESVFTTMRVENGRGYFVQAHRERLQQSVAWLWPQWMLAFQTGWDEIMATLPLGVGAWRVALSGDGSLRFHTLWQDGIPPTQAFDLQCAESPSRDESRPAFLKLPDYEARQKVSTAGLYVSAGSVCEMLYHNVVFLKDQTFHTPLCGPQVLAGVGRMRFKQWAQCSGWGWVERTISQSELRSFEASFAVNAVRGVTRIASIDGHSYRAHPVEEKLLQEFFVHGL
jgi:branched-subunit amino acid aminotransferase/4-amino-4-deoxychorismate lyase